MADRQRPSRPNDRRRRRHDTDTRMAPEQCPHRTSDHRGALMDQALWALGRGTGIAALVLLTLSMASGMVTRSGRPILTLPRFGVVELHKNTSLRSEEHTSELQSLMRISYAVFCLKKKTHKQIQTQNIKNTQ